MVHRESTRSEAYKRGSRRSSYSFLDDFEEPDLDNRGNPGLKTTRQRLADPPDANALDNLEDPTRVQRVSNRMFSRQPRRPPKFVNENGNSDITDQHEPEEEKLFLRLRRNLVSDPDSEYSEMRESHRKGLEDYRHNRFHPTETRKSKKRRTLNDTAKNSLEQPRRARRSTRPAVYEYETVLDENGQGSLDRTVSVEDGDFATNAKHQKLRGDSKKSSRDSKNVAPSLVDTSQHSESESKVETVSHDSKPTEGKSKGIINNDYCNSCGGTGELLCCESCARSFHFSCIEPPVMAVEEISDSEWCCRHCKPISLSESEKELVSGTFFEPLIISLEAHNAVAYQLPTNIRELFAHVQTSRFGEFTDEFMKTENVAPGPRIQDKNGNTLLCFKCHESSLRNRSLAVCSRCQEPWHIDCVSPPLESTPLGYWVCPLHAGNSLELPLRVKRPHYQSVRLKRNIANNGDIEINEEEDEVDKTSNSLEKDGCVSDNTINEINHKPPAELTDREDAGAFEDEEVTRSIAFPAQSRMLSDGSLVAKSSRVRPRLTESDKIVHKLSPRTIKLDFSQAVRERRSEPYRETPLSDYMLALEVLAKKPQPEQEAVRNLMQLKLRGPAVSTAMAKYNLGVLLDAALDDESEFGQVAAIRRLMKETGKERLMQILMSNT